MFSLTYLSYLSLLLISLTHLSYSSLLLISLTHLSYLSLLLISLTHLSCSSLLLVSLAYLSYLSLLLVSLAYLSYLSLLLISLTHLSCSSVPIRLRVLDSTMTLYKARQVLLENPSKRLLLRYIEATRSEEALSQDLSKHYNFKSSEKATRIARLLRSWVTTDFERGVLTRKWVGG